MLDAEVVMGQMQALCLVAVGTSPVKIQTEILLESAAIRDPGGRLLFSLDLRHLALY